jgi:FAD/FMN-containing dehydrogenase
MAFGVRRRTGFGSVVMSRRAFFHAAGVGAAAAAVACTHGGRPGLRALSMPPVAGPDWSRLRSRLSGSLVLPGDADYDAATRSFNRLFDERRPAGVVRCARPEDVQLAVEVAATSQLPIAARSGGHSYAGYSTPDQGLVVDLAKMAGVDVRPDGTAVVGAGTRLIDLYTSLAEAGRCLPAGTCPTVGIAGLTLGGGLGVLNRKLGLTCDRLLSAKVVTPDAMLRTASTVSEPDLFWALRGGGGGNLGIVTSFEFSTERAPDLTVFSLGFPGGSVMSVLGGWQEWIPAAPDELWSNCIISSGTPPTCRVGGCFIGSVSALQPLLSELLRLSDTRPVRRFLQGMSCPDAMRYFAHCSQRSVSQCHLEGERGGLLARGSFVASSRVMAKPIADTGRVASLLDRPAGVDALFDGLGGAVSRVAVGATAFPHRTAIATVQIYCSADEAHRQQAAQVLAEMTIGLGELVGTGAYVNYIDPGLPDWARAYYGSNLGRLREIAHRYDPDGVFSFPQGLSQAS